MTKFNQSAVTMAELNNYFDEGVYYAANQKVKLLLVILFYNM